MGVKHTMPQLIYIEYTNILYIYAQMKRSGFSLYTDILLFLMHWSRKTICFGKTKPVNTLFFCVFFQKMRLHVPTVMFFQPSTDS